MDDKSVHEHTFATPLNTAPLQAGDLVDEREAAAILRVETRTLRNWRSLRKGPPYRKIGQRLVRYNRHDLAVFIESATAPAIDPRTK